MSEVEQDIPTDPVIDQVVDDQSVTESVIDQVIETVIEPVTYQVVEEQPVDEPVTDKVIETADESVVEEQSVDVLVIETVAEPVIDQVIEDQPVTEPVIDQVVEDQSVDVPVTDQVIDQVVEDQDNLSESTEEQPVADANAPVPEGEEPEVKLHEIYISPEEEEVCLNQSNDVQPPAVNIPELVFIVPYRDRETHYRLFSSAMKDQLVDAPTYKILYINQTDDRGFNRGAMKNIGFLAVKNMYPNDYQNITLVFNDIDTIPAKDTIFNYKTTTGVIKHFYGFEYTLGGIVSMLASDFERINGFPNFWAWGYEDNLLQIRADYAGMVIDRSVFYKIHDPHIIHLVDTPIRTVNRAEFDRYTQNTKEGIDSIKDLNYKVNDETGFIDVLQFNTTVQETLEKRSEYDLRNGPSPFKEFTRKPRRGHPLMKMHF